MAENIHQRLATLPDQLTARELGFFLRYLYDKESTVTLTTPALAINGAGNAAVKAGSTFYACVQGKLVSVAANTLMAALSGTVANGAYNVFCFYMDGSGNQFAAMGTAGSTLGAVKWPAFPQNTASIGFVIIHPTGTGAFVGNTTPLDDATVVPNAVYVNTVGAFDPTATYTF
jgi:hypothetical protein